MSVFKFVVLVVLCLKTTDCGLISQSTIQQCTRGDSSEPQGKGGETCSRKIVVSMTLRSGQAETDALYANLNRAFDTETGKNGILKQPFRIEISKNLVIANYRVYYRGSANAHPKEHVIFFSKKRCNADPFSHETTCGRYTDINGKIIANSEGFCCDCSSVDDSREFHIVFRSNSVCGVTSSIANTLGLFTRNDDGSKQAVPFTSTGHCMNFSKLWYDIYEIELPSLHYVITVNLFTLQAVRDETRMEISGYNWTMVSSFTLSPDKPSARSPDGTVTARIQGDLLGRSGPMDLSAKKLLIPSLRAWYEDYIPEEVVNGPSDWLLVDEHLVDLSGRECNKVGVYFEGFRFQPGRCQLIRGSCFSNQPSQLWKADDIRRSNGIKGFYMLHNYGELHPSTSIDNNSFIMRLVYNELHNSFVTFEIDATDVSFVINVGKGRIISAVSRGFNVSTATTGEVVIIVENTGELTQDYHVGLAECFGRNDLPSRRVSIIPGETQTVSFFLKANNVMRITTDCEVQLFDRRFSLLGTARLKLSVEAPCFCFGVCDCTCDQKTGEVTENECPTPPPIFIDTSTLVSRVILYFLNFLGLHTFVAFFGGILIACGMVRLVCGGVLFCRKSKAQQHFDDMRKKHGGRKQATLVKCSGQCRGALAAKARVKRKAERLRRMGKDAHRLDDWANLSFECTCNSEVADLRCIAVIKSLCFFYYLLILPFILLGKKLWWCIFKDTVDKKKAAEKAAIKCARRKGPNQLEKVGVVTIKGALQETRNEHKKYEKKKEKILKEMEKDKLKEEEKRLMEIKKKEDKLKEVDVSKDPDQSIEVIADIEDIWEDEIPGEELPQGELPEEELPELPEGEFPGEELPEEEQPGAELSWEELQGEEAELLEEEQTKDRDRKTRDSDQKKTSRMKTRDRSSEKKKTRDKSSEKKTRSSSDRKKSKDRSSEKKTKDRSSSEKKTRDSDQISNQLEIDMEFSDDKDTPELKEVKAKDRSRSKSRKRVKNKVEESSKDLHEDVALLMEDHGCDDLVVTPAADAMEEEEFNEDEIINSRPKTAQNKGTRKSRK